MTPEDVANLVCKYGWACYHRTGHPEAAFDAHESVMSAIRSLCADNAALQARVEAASLNERRYLWLKSRLVPALRKTIPELIEILGLDAAIDAALSGEGVGG